MKQSLRIAFVLFVAWMGAWAVTACADKDDELETGDGTIEAVDVPVQFVFNVATGNNNASTRMTAANTQATPDQPFRGITETRILSYQVKDANGVAKNGVHVPAPMTASRLFDLSTIVGPEDIDANNSRRVIELSLPNGTNALMFYGKAIKSQGTTNEEVKRYNKEQGRINSDVFVNNGASDTETTRFSLVPRMSVLDEQGDSTTEIKVCLQTRKAIEIILNRITENGLHYETADNGGVELRDLRARIWWPRNSVDNYSLAGPLHNTGTRIDTLTEANSNIEDVVGATANVEIKYNGTTVGTYNASNATLTTNVDTYDFHLGVVDWKEYGQLATSNATATTHFPAGYTLTPLEEILGNAYNTFTVMKAGEIRAGSAMSVFRMVQDLWTVTNQVMTARPTQYNEALAQALAQRIFTRFYTYFTAQIDENGIVTNCQLMSPKALVHQILTFVPGYSEGDFDAIKDDDTTDNINLFPTGTDLNLPAGAAQLTCSNGIFSYVENPSFGDLMGRVSPTSFTWPAELLYFGNSPVRTSEKTLDPIHFPNGVANWNDDSQWSAADGWTGDHLSPLTRSVAMKYNIQYGTSMLATTIHYASGTLKDNNSGVNPGEVDNTIAVDNASSNAEKKFELIGVIVGGQCKDVGWEFTRDTTNASNLYTYMVYDTDVPKTGTYGAAVPAYNSSENEQAKTSTNYTLLFDNWNLSQKDAQQNKVYVALEMRNCSGRDFWGIDNIVRDGGIFYLVAELDPDKFTGTDYTSDQLNADRSLGISWPDASTQALPPYDANGNTITQRRVFIQDYVTTANFGIGENSLKRAYVTVPDLRSANVSLGLSVDIEWRKGLEYNMVIGE